MIGRRVAESEYQESKRVEIERTPQPRPYNAFKKTYESPVKKSLISQIHSVVVKISCCC